MGCNELYNIVVIIGSDGVTNCITLLWLLAVMGCNQLTLLWLLAVMGCNELHNIVVIIGSDGV